MTHNPNAPVGPALDFTGPWPLPQRQTIKGKWCDLEPLAPSHANGLFNAFSLEQGGTNWTYLPFEKPDDRSAFLEWVTKVAEQSDPFFYAVLNKAGNPVGIASYLRINPIDGSIEIGWISMSPAMQRTVISTEAMFLMISHALGNLRYRRCEWKCDNLNGPSKSAALRLGFTFEGIFRQATHYKGRSRDTAWFSIIDQEWIPIQKRFMAYLSPENFSSGGQQIKRLADC